jgi:hypothetical protein
MALGKLLLLSLSHFPGLWKMSDNSTHFMELWSEFDEVALGKPSAWLLARHGHPDSAGVNCSHPGHCCAHSSPTNLGGCPHNSIAVEMLPTGP